MTAGELLTRFEGDWQRALSYCIRVSIEKPQFKAEYDALAYTLAHGGTYATQDVCEKDTRHRRN